MKTWKNNTSQRPEVCDHFARCPAHHHSRKHRSPPILGCPQKIILSSAFPNCDRDHVFCEDVQKRSKVPTKLGKAVKLAGAERLDRAVNAVAGKKDEER